MRIFFFFLKRLFLNLLQVFFFFFFCSFSMFSRDVFSLLASLTIHLLFMVASQTSIDVKEWISFFFFLENVTYIVYPVKMKMKIKRLNGYNGNLKLLTVSFFFFFHIIKQRLTIRYESHSWSTHTSYFQVDFFFFTHSNSKLNITTMIHGILPPKKKKNFVLQQPREN